MKIENFIGKFINEDNYTILKKLPKESIDLIVTSPPYDDLRDYENEIEWDFNTFKKLARQIYRVMKKGGTVVWVVGDKTTKGNKSLTSFRQAIYFQEIGFNMFDVIIYEKSGSSPPHPKRYFNTFEYMFVLSKGPIKTVNLLKDKPNKYAGVETYGEVTRREKDGSLTKKGKKIVNEFGTRTNIWKYINGKGFTSEELIAHEHPAIFPEKLAQDHIYSWSNEGDIVLDVFGGSGTTIKMAHLLKRRWIYVEKVAKYCEIAEKRFKEVIEKENNDTN